MGCGFTSIEGFTRRWDISAHCHSRKNGLAMTKGSPHNPSAKEDAKRGQGHVGLCTHNGPNEMLSYLKLQFVNASAPIIATLNFEGRECSYRGHLSESSIGVLTCSGGLTLPLRLWAKV